jgi:transcriptional regulator with XRE-family HTH domain
MIGLGELAEKAGISKGTLSMAERGLTMLASDNLGNICRVLQVSADYIIYGKSEFASDEWTKLSATKEGIELKRIVLKLHRDKKLAQLLGTLNHVSEDNIALLTTMAGVMRSQAKGQK